VSNVISLAASKGTIKSTVIHLFAVAFIVFVPAISHLVALPVYYLEPMRIMLIIALVHTTKKNAYLLALTLPIFSFLVSAHPSAIKTFLIISELLLNVFLFYVFSEKIKNNFLAMITSLSVSKIIYYLVKFMLLSTMVLEWSLVSTPLYIQGVMMLLFSSYVFILLKKPADTN
jgi:hypothetical protein